MIHISWGFIGCGEVTELKSGPAFNAVEGSHVEAVYSRNADKARDYAERHHIKNGIQMHFNSSTTRKSMQSILQPLLPVTPPMPLWQ